MILVWLLVQKPVAIMMRTSEPPHWHSTASSRPATKAACEEPCFLNFARLFNRSATAFD
jgi:hypothetical protein